MHLEQFLKSLLKIQFRITQQNEQETGIISNCTQYGPFVIELLFHKFSFQERYLELMNDSHFTFKLQGVNTSVFVGNDAVTERVALFAGQFRCKQETFEQAIDQSIQSTSYKNNRNHLIKTLT